jgi:hypothetical protein
MRGQGFGHPLPDLPLLGPVERLHPVLFSQSSARPVNGKLHARGPPICATACECTDDEMLRQLGGGKRRKLTGMTQFTAPHLVDDGAVKRCSACSQVFDSKSIADLRRSFAEHVRLTHKQKSRDDVD